ncbi:MAG: methyltransferase [Candidatus Acidiferrales bacterium]
MAAPWERQKSGLKDVAEAIRDTLALFLLWFQLPIPLFWLLVHPAAGFWRRHPRACYYVVGPTVWLSVAVMLFGGRDWWLAERFWPAAAGWIPAALGSALIIADFWMIRRIERVISVRVLVGLPELFSARSPEGAGRPTQVVESGLYARVRHPRYLGMMMSWVGAALISGASRLGALAVVFIGLALLVTELEERELLNRLGESYADYRRRVPRLIPRVW